MNVFVSVAIVFLITISAIGVVSLIGSQTIQQSRSFSEVSDVEQFFNQLDNSINEVVAEGRGASRTISVTLGKDFVINPSDESIQRETSSGSFDYMSRIKSGNLFYIAGDDVVCTRSDENGDGNVELVAENTYVKAVFQNISKTSNFTTSGNIISLLEKNSGQKIIISNSSIIIDDNETTSSGSGYSELLETGSRLPVCTVHFFVNSTTIMYDVYYKLYAGADFIVADVRNIVDK
ncbi:MAG: hypothetical protein HZB67_03100 [Candidatus Aenigmarchaeota archaeon]|nr:hypothetical protein [Candidatus Aenigmarchaeota archaeon]